MTEFQGETPTTEVPPELAANVVSALREKLAAANLLDTAQETVDVSSLVSTVVRLATTEPDPQPDTAVGDAPVETGQAGRDCFFPDRDAEAAALLSELGASALQFMTVPNAVDMSGTNTALALMSGVQVTLYANVLAQLAEGYPGVDPELVRKRVCLKIVLIKESATGMARDGTLIHEAGHVVLNQAKETGHVFAYEINTICDKYGPATAVEWVMGRPIAYYAQKVNGSPEVLDKVMESLGGAVAEAWASARGLVVRNREAAKAPVDPAAKKKFTVIAEGQEITGTLVELRATVGPPARESTIPRGAEPGAEVTFGDIKWTVLDIRPGTDGGDTVYTLKRLAQAQGL
jgi:hypothetical protein